MLEVRDFNTAGVVAFATGSPFSAMASGEVEVRGQRIKVDKEQLETNKKVIEDLAGKLI